MDKIILIDETDIEFSKLDSTYVFRNDTILEGYKFEFLKSIITKEELENKLNITNLAKVKFANKEDNVYGIYNNLICDSIEEKDSVFIVVLLFKLSTQ